MGRIAQLFERRGDISGLANPDQWLLEILGGRKTSSGIHVTERKALALPAVWSAVNLISSTVASLPLHTYRRRDSGKEKAQGHPVYSLLHDAPNPFMTAVQFRKALTGHLLLWGNAYALIERDGAGDVMALWPLSPAITRPEWRMVGGELRVVYTTVINNEAKTFLEEQVLHLAGLGFDGLQGYSVVAMEREAIGLGLAMQEMTGHIVANNAVPPIVILHPGGPSFDAQQKIVEAFRKGTSGENVGKVGFLGEAMQIKELGMPLKDAEFLAQRNYSVTEVARMFNLPGAMIEASDKSPTYASAEQFNLWLVQHTVRPWLVTWEQGISLRLFSGLERRRYFAEHSVEGLLRGDSQARAEYYTKMFSVGAFNINDIRELENKNGIGPAGDKHYVPLNMAPADSPPPPSVPARSLAPVLRDAAARVLAREEADIMREARKCASEDQRLALPMWLESFFESHTAFTERALRPFFEAGGRPEGAQKTARNHCQKAKMALISAVFRAIQAKNDPVLALQATFDAWQAAPEAQFEEV